MAYCRLRVYHGPEDHGSTPVGGYPTAKSCITLPVSEILPLLADAVASERTWLGDFEDDEITISSDLYEVLMAYRHFRPVA